MEEISHRQEPTTRNDVSKAFASDFVPELLRASTVGTAQPSDFGIGRKRCCWFVMRPCHSRRCVFTVQSSALQVTSNCSSYSAGSADGSEVSIEKQRRGGPI